MAKITINKNKIIYDEIPYIKDVSFDYLGDKVYDAQKIQKMYGIFVSLPVIGESNLVSWKELLWSAQKPQGTDVWVYLKSASTEELLSSASWIGPYLNSSNDISDIKDKCLQFMIILSNDGTYSDNYQYTRTANTPVFSSMNLVYFSSSNASKFYTKTFDLGFTPSRVLLTYKGDVSEDSVLKFAISGFDSIDVDDYQYIEANKIEELSDLSILSDKIKLMIEMIGDSGVPIKIDEFALAFSGSDNPLMLNDINNSTSSSSSSLERIVLDADEAYEFTDYTHVLIEFTGSSGETATVILNEFYSYVVGNTGGQFVWDIGGSNEHLFTYVGESISQIAGDRVYTIVWNGFASLLFVVTFIDELSSSSSSASSSSSTQIRSSSSSMSSSTQIRSSSSSVSSFSSSLSSSTEIRTSSSSSSSSTEIRSSSSTEIRSSSSSLSSSSSSGSSSPSSGSLSSYYYPPVLTVSGTTSPVWGAVIEGTYSYVGGNQWNQDGGSCYIGYGLALSWHLYVIPDVCMGLGFTGSGYIHGPIGAYSLNDSCDGGVLVTTSVT